LASALLLVSIFGQAQSFSLNLSKTFTFESPASQASGEVLQQDQAPASLRAAGPIVFLTEPVLTVHGVCPSSGVPSRTDAWAPTSVTTRQEFDDLMNIVVSGKEAGSGVRQSVATLYAAYKHSNPTRKELSFGNLRKLYLEGGTGGYTLNGVALAEVFDEPLYLSTVREGFKVKVTFLETVLVSRGKPVISSKRAVVHDWTKRIPLVAQILKKQDSIGSVKPVVYDLIEARGRTDLRLQEELVFLWSPDPTKRSQIRETPLLPPSPVPIEVKGDTALMASTPFSTRVIDVQYRGLQGGVDSLIGKVILQILYIRDRSKHLLLGGFVIVSRPDGEYEFYLVPIGLLKDVIIEAEYPTSGARE
jgi:hypothetical protein